MKKKNLALIISVLVVFIIGIVSLIIYNELNGLRFIDMITSKYGLTIIIIMCFYALVVGIFLLKDKIRRW